ncbi:MAG: glycosyl transferase, partial [Lutimonas sp.]
VDKAFEKVDRTELTLVQCDNYGEAGAVNFYSKNTTGEALTIDADYMYWYPLDDGEIMNVILVKGPWDEDPERTRERDLVDSIELIGEITNSYAREKGTKVYLLKGAKVSVNEILREEIEKRIAREQ